jgi:hypothetical protein
MNLTEQYHAKLESRKAHIEATNLVISKFQVMADVMLSEINATMGLLKVEADKQIAWHDEDLKSLAETIGHVPPSPLNEVK